ncbi:MAG: DNA cytosine methyltransferase, partial [Myxococcota bacterium]
MSLGLEAAGFDIAVAIEYDAVHASVHHFNFPYGETICKDITYVSANEIMESLRRQGRKEEVDLVSGGPPCQGFSQIGKRQFEDPRNSLLFEYIRLVRELRPKYFFFENVPGLASGEHRQFLLELVKEFQRIGYRIHSPIHLLDGADYGAPQRRKRLIVIGSRQDMPLAHYPKKESAALGSASLNKITGTAQLGTSSGWPTEPSHDSVSSTCHTGLPHDDFPSTSHSNA